MPSYLRRRRIVRLSFQYDDVLMETRITDSLGQCSTIQFDERYLPVNEIDALAALLLCVRRQRADNPSRILGNQTAYEYDERGNLCGRKRTAPTLKCGSTLKISSRGSPIPMAGLGADVGSERLFDAQRFARIRVKLRIRHPKGSCNRSPIRSEFALLSTTTAMEASFD